MSSASLKTSNAKRLGFGRACQSCRRKKHRCDAIRPQCSGCRSRDIVCQYVANGTELNEQAPNRNGVGVISGEIEQPRAIDEIGTMSDTPSSRTESQSIHSRLGVTESPSEVVPRWSNRTTGYMGDSSAINFVSGSQTEIPQPPEERVDPVIVSNPEHFVAHTPTSRAADDQEPSALPDREQANRLVDAYFTRVHLLYPFVHEPSFRSQYERLWSDDPPRELAWLAVVNIIFAYGCEFCAADTSSSQEAFAYVGRAKRIILSQVFKLVDLNLTQALLLLCHYLQGALELNECWNFFGLAIRSSISIGLHIDPTGDKSFGTVEREVRKRVWWGCFVLDRTLSMKSGRPPSIALADAIDVEFPAEVDDQYIMDLIDSPRQPGSRPARPSLFVQTIGLSKVIDNILSMLYLRGTKKHKVSRGAPSIGEQYTLLGNIVLVDGQLEAWWENVPSHLKTTTLVSEGPDLERQHNVLYLRYVQMRLLLLRPSFILLSKSGFQDPFLRTLATTCAERCLSVARETIQLVHLHYPRQMLHSMWYILHYMFSASGVLLYAQTLGISTTCDPMQVSDAAALDDGMAFFRSAGQYSSLAQRYLQLLERFRAQANRLSNQDIEPLVTEGSKIDASGTDCPYAAGSVTYRQGQHSTSDAQSQALFDPGRISFPDPNDFLYGMGLPHDLLTTDWSSYSINMGSGGFV